MLSADTLHSASFYDAIIKYDSAEPLHDTREVLQDESFYAQSTRLDEATLDTLRGGFSVSGMDLNFGAVLKTQIDSMVLESIVTIDQSGARLSTQMLNGMDIGSLPGDIQASVVGSGASLNDVAPGSLNLTGLKDYSGLAINDSKGFTAALHNITKQAIVSAVVSDASQRSVQQTIDININVRNMPALQAASQRQAILNSLSR
ncbi:hypothetical protein [Franzmannia pantelleriensis]|nr:hypothetical protein [Halomonas pantelleriensis]